MVSKVLFLFLHKFAKAKSDSTFLLLSLFFTLKTLLFPSLYLTNSIGDILDAYLAGFNVEI